MTNDEINAAVRQQAALQMKTLEPLITQIAVT